MPSGSSTSFPLSTGMEISRLPFSFKSSTWLFVDFRHGLVFFCPFHILYETDVNFISRLNNFSYCHHSTPSFFCFQNPENNLDSPKRTICVTALTLQQFRSHYFKCSCRFLTTVPEAILVSASGSPFQARAILGNHPRICNFPSKN